MKHIALWGYYGFGNVGDEALLSNILPHLKNVKVHLFSGDQPSVKQKGNVLLENRSPSNLFNVVRSCDAFVLGPGGLLHERPNVKSTWYHLAGLFLAKTMNIPHIAVSQQIGPFSRKMTKKLVRLGLSKSSFLSVRDKKSYDEATTLGLDCILSSDLAFLTKPEPPSDEVRERIMKMHAPRTIFVPAVSDEYKPNPKFIASILNNYHSYIGGSIIMLPFFPGRDDMMIDETIKHIDFQPVLKLESPLKWRDAFGAFYIADYSIPMRLHGMIASAVYGKPFLPILYHDKVKRIGTDIGCSTFVSEFEIDPEGKIKEFINNSDDLSLVIKSSIEKLKNRALLSVKGLEDFLSELI
jgi:polysaccharide pyruvyl transferase CsaB